MSVSLRLRFLPERLAIVRLAADAPIPRWASRSSRWFSITRTHDELSIVCNAAAVPEGVAREACFGAFGVEGPLDFALTGVLASLAAPLAAAKISIFAISTFDTDYVLVREESLMAASRALRTAGHKIIR